MPALTERLISVRRVARKQYQIQKKVAQRNSSLVCHGLKSIEGESTMIQFEFKFNVCQTKEVFFSPEVVAKLFNQKYIIIKATYRPLQTIYTRILLWRLKRRETQIKGSKISNSLVWQKHGKLIKERSTLQYNWAAKKITKTLERWGRTAGWDLVWDELHPLDRLTQYLALVYEAERSLCGFVESLWHSITGLWLADGAAGKAVYPEMHPAFYGRACLLKSCRCLWLKKSGKEGRSFEKMWCLHCGQVFGLWTVLLHYAPIWSNKDNKKLRSKQ